jgi:secreted trypsin-like serine protease
MNYVSITFVVAYTFLYLELVISSPLQNDDRHLKSRIIGGTIANAQRYPYYTYIEMTFQSGSRSFCGGSLVNPDVVLTAAHCIEEDYLDPIVEVMALVNYTQSVDVTGFLTGYEHYRAGTALRIHGSYDSIRLVNDIGLIYLNSPVYEVTPVNLNDDGNLPADGDPVTVFGHGRISNAETPEFPYYLMEVSVSIVPFQDCNDQNSYWGGIVDQSMICAGASSGGKGTCNGDSGGPLIILGNSATQDVQVGIVSFGSSEGCSIVNYPSVFTRVSNYRQWIQDLICLYSKVKPQSCSSVAQPTSQPTNPPTPSSKPTNKPAITNPPTPTPTREPTNKPVVTNPPTPTPTREPTKMPTVTNPPTPTPTTEPTIMPVITNPPTSTPTSEPTIMPVITNPPTSTPTTEPTIMPVITNPPTSMPTTEPTNMPVVTNPPTATPTSEPTNMPVVTSPPTPTPTKKPVVTNAPTQKSRPTFRPTPAPSRRTKAPTRNPTVKKKKITSRPSPSPSKPSLPRSL